MRNGFRIALLASLGAHIALLFGAGLLYIPGSPRDTGAAAIAVRILADEPGPDPSPPKRVREERHVWTPREAPTPASRLASTAPSIARKRPEATRPALQPRDRPATPIQRVAHPSPPLPGPVATHHNMTLLSAPQPGIEEHLSALQPSPSQGEGRERVELSSNPPLPPSLEERGAGSPLEPSPSQGEDQEATAASVLTYCQPVYPRQSRLLGEQGTVVLFVEIGADGRPGAIVVTKSSGHTRLDAAAVQALRKATFVPARRRGEPVPSVKRIAIAFRLTEPAEDEE